MKKSDFFRCVCRPIHGSVSSQWRTSRLPGGAANDASCLSAAPVVCLRHRSSRASWIYVRQPVGISEGGANGQHTCWLPDPHMRGVGGPILTLNRSWALSPGVWAPWPIALCSSARRCCCAASWAVRVAPAANFRVWLPHFQQQLALQSHAARPALACSAAWHFRTIPIALVYGTPKLA